MSSKQIIYESGANLNKDEQFLLNWVKNHVQGQTITVLAESTVDGVRTPDILVGRHRVEFKTTSGSLTTLDSLLRRGGRQSKGECVIVHLRDIQYSLDEAKQVATHRMERSGISEVYLLHQDAVVHLQNQKEEAP